MTSSSTTRAALLGALVAAFASGGWTTAGAQGTPPATPVAEDIKTIRLKPRVVPVGRWPEGLAWDGASVWVAESGVQRIARIDTVAGKVVETARVGRLPVDMASGANGAIYAMVNTEQRVFVKTPGGKGAVLTGIAGCPDKMIAHGGALLALAWPDCSSRTSQVVAIDPGNGARRVSADLGRDGFAIAASGDTAWVARGAGGRIDVVDVASLKPTGSVEAGGALFVLAAADGAVFAGGREGADRGAPRVVRIDAASRAVTHRATLPGGGHVKALVLAGPHLIAAGEKGALFVLAAADLKPLARLVVDGPMPVDARRLLVVGDRLFVSSFVGDGDHNAVVILEGWRP